MSNKTTATARALYLVLPLVVTSVVPAWAVDKNPHSCVAAASTRPTAVSFLLYAGRGENLPKIGEFELGPNQPMGDLTVTASNRNVRGPDFTVNAPRDVTPLVQFLYDGTVRTGSDGFTCDGTTYITFH